MKKTDNSIKITGMIIAAVLVIFIVSFVGVKSTIQRQTITATGEATVTVIPDMVSIYFNVETTANDSVTAKDKNTKIVNDVVDALMAEGFERSNIETSNFNVYEDYDWSNGARKSIGFKAAHTLKVKFNHSDYQEIGPIVDTGIDNGALLNYVSFELSPEEQNKYEAQALELAGVDAKTKATAMVSGVGAKLGKLISVSDSSSSYYPWRVYDTATLEYAGDTKTDNANPSTPIQPGEKEITSRISVIYEIK